MRWFQIGLLCLVGMCLTGCGGWNAEFTEGSHETEYHYGLIVEWGTKVYIGPPMPSKTRVINKFEGTAKGKTDEKTPTP